MAEGGREDSSAFKVDFQVGSSPSRARRMIQGVVPGKGACSNVGTAQISLTLRDSGEVLEVPQGSGMQRMYQLWVKGRKTRVTGRQSK